MNGLQKRKTLKQKIQYNRKLFKRDWQLHFIIAIPVIYSFVMLYMPMYGAQIAFRDYNPFLPMSESEWVGFYWFEKFIKSEEFLRLFKNTFILSVYGLVVGFPLPIIFALTMNALRNQKYAKVVSFFSYIPNYISLTVMVGIITMLCSPVYGLYGNLFRIFGGEGYPVDFRPTKEAFRHLYIWSGVWQGFGWGSIMYTAALSAVPMELHEAARIDGASRFKRIFYIDLPTIKPTIAIMLIMRVGSMLGSEFEKTYLMQSSLNKEVSEVVATYVYTYGLSHFENFSYASAIGLFNSFINVVLLVIANKVSNKLTGGEVGLW